MPPELRWQSGRLLTDRSLVRSQVVAVSFSLLDADLQAKRSPARKQAAVLVAQLDKASDYESED